MNRPILIATLTLLTACAPGGRVSSAPVSTSPPNAPSYQPAFPEQARAPEVTSKVAYQATVLVENLGKPWGLAFLPGGALLISEKAGALRIFEDGKVSAPITAGLPKIDAQRQGGLLGLAVDPAFAANGLIYFAFSEPDPAGGNHTAVGRAKLVQEGAGGKLEDVRVIWRQTPSLESGAHYGGRLVFARDGTLFVTTGERSILAGRMQAQRLDGTLGKVVRIRTDGSIPADNPFVNRPGVKPEIWSLGQRNVQGAALNPATGELWTNEHGARGGDELNITRKGRDYGWPTITYGIEYIGPKIGEGITQKAGMEQPVYYWDPVIAPSGMAFYTADLFPAWKGSLFIGGLKDQRLTRLVLKGEKVVGEERLLGELKERIRDVVVGPDGALYIATDSDKGRVIRVAPK